MLELQKYLLEHSPEKLKEELFITYKQSTKYPNLYLFKYDGIHSPMDNIICQQARGIILDAHDNWKVISLGFTKFFNHDEGKAAKLDWNTTKIYTKQDGSLICLYRYNNEWLVATTGHPDAGGNVGDFGFTFAELFWKVFQEKQYKLPEDIPIVQGVIRYTYMFELETPYNRIVVDHQENNLTFLGSRNLDSLQEVEPKTTADYYGWNCVKEWEFNSPEELKAYLPTIDPLKQEGFVLRDGLFQRVKMKNEAYIALHHCLAGLSKRSMAQVIIAGEAEECRAMFKNFGTLFEDMLSAFAQLKKEATEVFEELNKIEDQKEFAKEVKKHSFWGILFNMRSKKKDADFVLKSFTADGLVALLEPYMPKEESPKLEKVENNG